MFQTICDLAPGDTDYSERTRQLGIYQKILDGSFYNSLPYEFHEERTSSGEYIPLRQRRPSVRYGLARLVVEDSVALLFSEGHFPAFDSPDPAVRDALAAIARDVRLNAVMVEAGLRGSIGSVALLLRVLRGRVFVDVLDTPYLAPEWAADAPDTLSRVTERYKVSGASLAQQGFAVPDPGAAYWFIRVWDTEYERWFEPLMVGSLGVPVEDVARTVRHGLGFVPLVWIRNLPGGNGIDGACTFRSAIDTSIEIDYQLSQAGRGLKYPIPPTTQSNDGWKTLSNQSWNVAVAVTAAAANAGATALMMTSVANLVVGQAVSGTGIGPGTTVTAVSGTTITVNMALTTPVPAATQLSFGTANPALSAAELHRQSYNSYLRQSASALGCTGVIDDDAVFADPAGSGKWRTDLGPASADGVHPAAALHQAAVNAGLISPAMFLAP